MWRGGDQNLSPICTSPDVEYGRQKGHEILDDHNSRNNFFPFSLLRSKLTNWFLWIGPPLLGWGGRSQLIFEQRWQEREGRRGGINSSDHSHSELIRGFFGRHAPT